MLKDDTSECHSKAVSSVTITVSAVFVPVPTVSLLCGEPYEILTN